MIAVSQQAPKILLLASTSPSPTRNWGWILGKTGIHPGGHAHLGTLHRIAGASRDAGQYLEATMVKTLPSPLRLVLQKSVRLVCTMAKGNEISSRSARPVVFSASPAPFAG